jgi:hypothetical protein
MFFEPTHDETLRRPQSTATWWRHVGYFIMNGSAIRVTVISVSNFQPIYSFSKRVNTHFVSIGHTAFIMRNPEMKGLILLTL